VTPVLLLLGSGSGISCILAVSFTSSELSSRCLVYDSGTPCEGEVGEVLRGVSCLLRTSWTGGSIHPDVFQSLMFLQLGFLHCTATGKKDRI